MNFKKGMFKNFAHLVEAIENLPRMQSTLLIGIDGCGGSGKSTLADRLKRGATRKSSHCY